MEFISRDIVGASSNLNYVVMRLVCLSHCCSVTVIWKGADGEVHKRHVWKLLFLLVFLTCTWGKSVKDVKILCVAKQLLHQKSY